MSIAGIEKFLEILRDVSVAIAAIGVIFLLVNGFIRRNWAQVGGKIGRRSKIAPLPPVPDGFARVECREIVNYRAPPDAQNYPDLKSYMREAAVRQPGLVHIYRVAGFDTRIEIPAAAPHYDRIDAVEALALLRELPDPRFIHRLHLADEPSFLDPWSRKVSGRDDVFHLGVATTLRLIVLYMPDRALGTLLGTVLLHEWAHLLGFKYELAVWRFKRANKVEPLPPLDIDLTTPLWWRVSTYEPWADFGEKLLGFDEALARETALAAPVHAMILWRCVEKVMRKVPKRFASTRRDEFAVRGAFMRAEVAPKARAARARRRWWKRWLGGAPPSP
jgi:hypothetical protein